jgi:hypothetical protein
VLQELAAARGRHRRFDAAFERFAAAATFPAAVPSPAATSSLAVGEAQARGFTQMFVTLMQAGILLSAAADPDAANPGARAVAEGFCATRLDAESGWGAVFGASAAALDHAAILKRAWDE